MASSGPAPYLQFLVKRTEDHDHSLSNPRRKPANNRQVPLRTLLGIKSHNVVDLSIASLWETILRVLDDDGSGNPKSFVAFICSELRDCTSRDHRNWAM